MVGHDSETEKMWYKITKTTDRLPMDTYRNSLWATGIDPSQGEVTRDSIKLLSLTDIRHFFVPHEYRRRNSPTIDELFPTILTVAAVGHNECCRSIRFVLFYVIILSWRHGPFQRPSRAITCIGQEDVTQKLRCGIHYQH